MTSLLSKTTLTQKAADTNKIAQFSAMYLLISTKLKLNEISSNYHS